MIASKAILGFSFLLIAASSFGQEGLQPDKGVALTKLQKAIEGTYQIQMLGTRKQPIVPLEVIRQIEDKRKENEIFYINYCPDYRIMVLPRNMISSESFVPVKPITFISLNEIDQ